MLQVVTLGPDPPFPGCVIINPADPFPGEKSVSPGGRQAAGIPEFLTFLEPIIPDPLFWSHILQTRKPLAPTWKALDTCFFFCLAIFFSLLLAFNTKCVAGLNTGDESISRKFLTSGFGVL